jgi:hypothetical protein
MKISYLNQADGKLHIVVGVAKEVIEKDLGKSISLKEYKDIIMKAVPEDATKVREIQDEDVPVDREFRDAWTDQTEGSSIDIDLEKAKELQLKKLRAARNEELEKLDKDFLIALEAGEETKITEIKTQKKTLRDATDPLKNLNVSGYNDQEVIEQIKSLGTLTEEG